MAYFCQGSSFSVFSHFLASFGCAFLIKHFEAFTPNLG